MGPPATEVRDDPPRALGRSAAVWVVSPHRLVAQAVRAALASTGSPVEFHPWKDVVNDAPTRTGHPDVRYVLAIFDGVDPPEAVDDIGRLVARGGVRVAVVTSAPTALWWGGLLAGTAVDVVTMTTSVLQLTDVVDRFIKGEALMDLERRQELRAEWFEALDKQRHIAAQVGTLSPQQLRVLGFLAAGRRVPEVAQLMGITDGTVRSHVKSLRAKLGAGTQLEAVAMLRQVYEVGGGTHLVPRPRPAPAESDVATIDAPRLAVPPAPATSPEVASARR